MNDPLQLELQQIREGAAIFPLTDRAFLRITGSDATRWLNGMVTNNIKDLTPGQGNYNFLLSSQGRIQGDCIIYREPGEGEPSFLLETGIWQLETIQTTLDKFIIMDDVELEVRTDRVVLLLAGPDAPSALTASDIFTEELAPGELAIIEWHNLDFHLVRSPQPKSATYEIWSSAQSLSLIAQALREAGAVEVTAGAIEAHRILSGTPKYGTDIRNTETAKDLPQETAQTHALNFNKGCYLGQEIVERIHSRGQVHRTFTQFTLNGTIPIVPTPLEVNGKSAGELTSVAKIGDALVALGYARREALDTNQIFTYCGGIANPNRLETNLLNLSS